MSDQTVFDIIEACFAWRKMGYTAGDYPGLDPEAPMRLFAAIVRDLDHTTAFGEAHLWMTPVEVENYVRERLRVTPVGWTPWVGALVGVETPTRTVMVKKLVELIAFNGMCFGDGPRWRMNMVHLWVEQWINGTAAGLDGVSAWF